MPQRPLFSGIREPQKGTGAAQRAAPADPSPDSRADYGFVKLAFPVGLKVKLPVMEVLPRWTVTAAPASLLASMPKSFLVMVLIGAAVRNIVSSTVVPLPKKSTPSPL